MHKLKDIKMVNINKIKTLAKNQGITIAFICKQLGNGRGYLNDVANGKNTMPDERIRKTAQILGTTFEYLTGQTDDPKPKNKKPPEIISNADIISDGNIIRLYKSPHYCTRTAQICNVHINCET